MDNPKRWWLVAAAVVAVVLVAGGAWYVLLRDDSGLPADDRELADEFWGQLNEFEQDGLCGELTEPAGRLAAADTLQDRLAELEPPSEFGGDLSDEELLEQFTAGVEQQGEFEDRAVAIVKYIDGKC